MSVAVPVESEKSANLKATARATKKKNRPTPVAASPAEPPRPMPRPSREHIFLMNQDLDGGPTPRDLSIHRAVMEEGRSQREVAVRHGISQARVSQIVKGVDEWSLQIAEDRYRDYTPEQRRRLAEHTFRERLNYFYSLTLEAWRASQQGETVDRTGGLDSGSITRNSFGKTCYLDAAMRIAERIAELDWIDVRSKRREPVREELATSPETVRGAPLGESPVAAPETGEKANASAAPKPEIGLSPVAPEAVGLSAERATQASRYSEVTESLSSASRAETASLDRREPLITPQEHRFEDPEREVLYRDLQALLTGLG